MITKDDLWPELRLAFDKIEYAFEEDYKNIYYIQAGHRSGLTTLSAAYANCGSDSEYEHVTVVNVTKHQANNLVSLIDASKNPKAISLEYLMKGYLEEVTLSRKFGLLIVENYNLIGNKSDLDSLLEKTYALVDVLLSGSNYPGEPGRTPDAKYSTWDLNKQVDAAQWRSMQMLEPDNFERDFGGGTPFPFTQVHV